MLLELRNIFLTAFQSDKPMILYFYFYLKSSIKQRLGVIVEPKIIDSCKTGKQLKDIIQLKVSRD